MLTVMTTWFQSGDGGDMAAAGGGLVGSLCYMVIIVGNVNRCV